MTRAIDWALTRNAWLLRKISRQRRAVTLSFAILGDRCIHSKRLRRCTWTVLLLLALASFSVRQILSAYLLFAALFLIAATVSAVFVTLDYIIGLGIDWVVAEMRGAFSVARHFAAIPARVPASVRRRVLQKSYRER